MTSDKLGELKKCLFSDVWANEREFSHWLATDGLDLLGKTLGMPLANAECEVPIGKFWADIVCTDANDESKEVVIENQRNYTDHSHLGQLLTYAAGKDAVTLVWIAEEFCEEHRVALDRLNETSDSVRLFGLVIELWRIGDSKPALKLCPVAKPKDSPYLTRRSATRRVPEGELSEYQKFWNGFRDYLIKAKIGRYPPENYEKLLLDRGIGRRGAKLGLVLRDYRERLGVKIYFDDPRLFKLLHKQKQAIEADLKCKHKTHWQEPSEDYNKYSFDCVWDADWRKKKRDAIYQDLAHEWQEIDRVFRPRLGDLDPDDWDEDGDQ